MSAIAQTTEPALTERESRDLIPPDSPLAAYIWVDPGRMHGEPCFKGTRIPIQTLFDHLRFGQFNEFFDGFPDVTREQVVGVIDLAAMGLLQALRSL